MSIMADFPQPAAQVAAALSEGFCPAGHLLTFGGGQWGTCYQCDLTWALCPAGYTYQVLGDRDAVTLVGKDGTAWSFFTF